MTAAHRSVPGWFYLLAAFVVVAGVAGSAAMILIHAAFGWSLVRSDAVYALGSSAAPVIAAAAWAWLAVRQARRGRFRIGVGMLAFAGVSIAMTLFLMMGPA